METKHAYCKRLSFNKHSGEDKPTILIGLILEEDDLFLTFKTAHKEYRINKKTIITIEETNILFEAKHNE